MNPDSPIFNASLTHEAMKYLLENQDAHYLAAMMAEEEDDDYEDNSKPEYEYITNVVDANKNVVSYEEMQEAIIMDALNTQSEQKKAVWNIDDYKSENMIKADKKTPVYNNVDFEDALRYAQYYADKQKLDMQQKIQNQADEIKKLQTVCGYLAKAVEEHRHYTDELTKEFEAMKHHVRKNA